jgi:DnaJ-class molecular chaperone
MRSTDPCDECDPILITCEDCEGAGEHFEEDQHGDKTFFKCKACKGEGHWQMSEEDILDAEGDRRYREFVDEQTIECAK